MTETAMASSRPAGTEATAPDRPGERVRSLDILRGGIMILMAIDHVRAYAGVPAGRPSVGVFLTRWITHFCAPGFVFFAGTSASLMSLKMSSRELTRFLRPQKDRDRQVLRLGLLAIVLFLVLRGFNLYGDPRPWVGHTWISFLNTAKYPASLQFLLMTLGPLLALIPVLNRLDGRLSGWFATFGRTPLFYCLLHIPPIHLVALVLSLVSAGSVAPWLFSNHPMEPGPAPEGYRWPLGELYLVTGAVVWMLYFPCRWFDALKRERTHAWTRWV